MITNISALNKDGIRMSIAEYDLTKHQLRVSYSKSRLDMEMKAAQVESRQTTQSDEIRLVNTEPAPLGQILTIKYFDIPEDAEEVLFIDREFDNRYQSNAKDFRGMYSKEHNAYKVDLTKLKRLR